MISKDVESDLNEIINNCKFEGANMETINVNYIDNEPLEIKYLMKIIDDVRFSNPQFLSHRATENVRRGHRVT